MRTTASSRQMASTIKVNRIRDLSSGILKQLLKVLAMAENMVVLNSEGQSPNSQFEKLLSSTWKPQGLAASALAFAFAGCAHFGATSSHVPPLASILVLAEALKAWALTVSFRVNSPPPRILMPAPRPLARPALAQSRFVHPGAVVEMVERFQVDGQVAGGVARVVESALGNAANQRHLAAFEADANRTAGAGGLALATAAAGFAVAAGFALAQPLAAVLGAGTRFEIM